MIVMEFDNCWKRRDPRHFVTAKNFLETKFNHVKPDGQPKESGLVHMREKLTNESFVDQEYS